MTDLTEDEEVGQDQGQGHGVEGQEVEAEAG